MWDRTYKSMKHRYHTYIIRPFAGILIAGIGWASLFGALLLHSIFSPETHVGHYSKNTINELNRLGLLANLSEEGLIRLIDYQESGQKTLAQILRVPEWRKFLGLSSRKFKATWYVENPFDLLPVDLQKAIKKRKIPFKFRLHVWQWCQKHKVSKNWQKALYAALIETTPHNLWRASRGQRSITTNGQFLEPIVIEHKGGVLEIKDGHIATDPRVIPTNSVVLLLVKINGIDRVLRVKATDTGAAIKGHHVDLPIHMGPGSIPFPHTRLPKEKIRNRSVEILTPI